jgi:hypothetical protein
MSDALYEVLSDMTVERREADGFNCTNCEKFISRDEAERGNIVFGEEWLTRFESWCSTDCRTETLRDWGCV